MDKEVCNELETQNILNHYFRGKIKISSVHKIKSDYYLCCTTPQLENEGIFCRFQYRDYWIGACFLELYKGSRVYELKYDMPFEPLNIACRKAIEEYEYKCSLGFPDGLEFKRHTNKLYNIIGIIAFIIMAIFLIYLMYMYITN